MAKSRKARSPLNYIDNLVSVVISPEVTPQQQNLSEDNFRFAELLTSLESFNEALSDVRRLIELHELLSYPRNPNIESVADLFFHKPITDKRRAVLRDWAKELRVKYNLPKSWDVPFQIAAITNVLPAPPKDSIGLHLPENFLPDVTRVSNDTSNTKVNIGRVLEYPAIYFTRQVSIDELKLWINDNKDLIRAIQQRLPENKKVRREPKTLLWGHIAWICRKGGIKSWTRISEKLQTWLNSKYEECEEIDDYLGEYAPSPGEIKKYHDRYVESLSKLEAS